ncbi:MAG: alginate lyase family protein [Alphaproteobacteria bacterium]|nr:alginate lyase family protein [Alphaproteobacteria bacterium]
MTRITARIAWYKNRLAAMSAAEIVYRVGQAARRKADFFRMRHIAATPRDYGVLPEIPGLGTSLALAQIDDTLMRQWEAEARRAETGGFSFLNQTWPPCPPEHVWHMDPVSGFLWPRHTYCFAVDYRHGGRARRGDVKFVWELNRLQYLAPVAALAFKRNDAALAQLCLSHIESWIDNNPPFLGVNWASGIELTLRLVSILTVTSLIGAQASRAARAKIWATLRTHGRWLARYPSRYSSANNHRLAEGLGLFMLGALCPHFPEAAAWKETGWDILRDGARHLILPDGAGAEQSTAYAAFSLEMLLAGFYVARHTGIDIPADYTGKIVLGGGYLRWLTDKNGNQPRIGDGDDACVFGTYRPDYVASVAACAAAVTSRADIAPPRVAPDLRQIFFGVADTGDFPPSGLRCFEHGGLTVGRHVGTAGEILFAFDHGYLGYLSIAAHGHADALAVWLHIDGMPVFVDAGTYLYHGDDAGRRHFRSTAAHNTLTMGGVDSSEMAGNFNWARKARCTLRTATSQGDFWRIEAEHDGYAERFDAIHRRAVHASPATGAVIEDMIIADMPQPVDIGFLIHPDLAARRDGADIVILKGETQILRLRHEGGLETDITKGFYSPAFAVKQPATRIVFRGTMHPDQKAVTHLFWAV